MPRAALPWAPPSALLEVRCLGSFRARLDGIWIPALANSKPLALWLYLALDGAERSRSHLADFFWGELGEEAARVNLRVALMRLRKLVPEHISVRGQSVAVPADAPRHIDAEHPPAGDGLDRGALDRLLAYRPEEFLSSVRLRHSPLFEDWVTAQRERLVAEHLRTLTESAAALAACRRQRDALDLYRRCLSIAPWSEEHHRALIRCYADLGQRASALAQFEACQHALRKELDVAPSDATLRVVESIKQPEREATPAAPSGASAYSAEERGRLLDPLAPLVNRAAEREHLVQFLRGDGCRLVSIVGPGGVGKTHLAQHAGEQLAPEFGDGVCFVPLADVKPRVEGQSASLVENRLAEALAVPLGTAPARAAVLAALEHKELLLVLDNFEQLTDAAELLDAIALRAPRVRVLVTTRHRLGLATEWILPLDGLDYPRHSEWDEESPAYPAVQLFVEVARRIEARFDAAVNGRDILRICRAVQGFPLAIILAARWLTTLTCCQIADRLSAGFALLSTGQGTEAPPPGGTLRAALDRSWELLDADERQAFGVLSVFRGGFDPAAAETVAGSDIGLIDRLVGKSLVRRRPEGRLEIHELMRDFGEEKLREAGGTDAARRAHAEHYAAMLRAELERFERSPLSRAFEGTRLELGNLTAAFEYRVAHGEIEEVAGLLHGLWWFHKRQGWFEDGVALLEQALALEGVPLELAFRWRLWLSDACFQLGRHIECKETVLASLAAAGEPLPERASAAWYALRELVKCSLPARWVSIGADRAALRDDMARTYNRLAQVYFFESDRLAFLGSTLRSLNVAAVSDAVEHWASGALAFAHTPLRPVAARYAKRAERAIDRAEPFARAWAHEQLALYHLGIGNLAASEAHSEQGLALFRALDQHKYWGECATLNVYAAELRADLDEAHARFGAALEEAREYRERFTQVWAICGLVHTDLRCGRQPTADMTEAAASIDALVDPNTHLLYLGTMAWLEARGGRDREAVSAVTAFHRVAERASMLSIYALNGFIGQTAALLELAAHGDGRSRSGTAARAALTDRAFRHFQRFAAPFPAAAPYLLYLRGKRLALERRPARAAALRARAVRLLAPDIEAARFEASFAL